MFETTTEVSSTSQERMTKIQSRNLNDCQWTTLFGIHTVYQIEVYFVNNCYINFVRVSLSDTIKSLSLFLDPLRLLHVHLRRYLL